MQPMHASSFNIPQILKALPLQYCLLCIQKQSPKKDTETENRIFRNRAIILLLPIDS